MLNLNKIIAGLFGAFWLSICIADPLFTDAELGLLKTHGPWPPLKQIDVTNRFSGNPKAIELGEFLFEDQRLSRTGTVSCATCHDPDKSYADGKTLSQGIAPVHRNTPTVLNMMAWRWFGWDGAADSLWAQSIRPILSTAEMDGAKFAVRALYENDEDFRTACLELFGAQPEDIKDEQLLVLTGKALAAWQETLISKRSRFDEFRDAAQTGDSEKIANYPKNAQRGAKIFLGEGRCSICHFGPAFTNSEFASTGLPHMTADGQVDKGRLGGSQAVKNSPYNLLSDYNDDDTGASSTATRLLRRRHDSFGEFRVPGLRDIAKTGPYMHDGSLNTLADVVQHYSELNMERLHSTGDGLLRPLKLSAEQQADLVAFLETL
ncbi:MAG: cytochrome c peroxidase [Parasphingorhabdus sp.]